MRNDYIFSARAGRERRALDYAPFRRQLRHSLKPASVIGPALSVVFLIAAAVLGYAVWVLSGPVTP